jgi:hypothetical protein
MTRQLTPPPVAETLADRLDRVAAGSGTATVLAVWAARAADAAGDTIEAELWATIAAESTGTLF